MGTVTYVLGILSIVIGFVFFGACFVLFMRNERVRNDAEDAYLEASSDSGDGGSADEGFSRSAVEVPYTRKTLVTLFTIAIVFMTVFPVAMAVLPAAIINTF